MGDPYSSIYALLCSLCSFLEKVPISQSKIKLLEITFMVNIYVCKSSQGLNSEVAIVTKEHKSLRVQESSRPDQTFYFNAPCGLHLE